jgi:hypothetical protein
MVDPNFTAVNPSAQVLRVAALNAAPGQTAEQYLASRGGVNAAGYYGDSWNSKENLTDAEYFDVLNKAISQGGKGSDLGAAINKATLEKAPKPIIKPKKAFSPEPDYAPAASGVNTLSTSGSITPIPLTPTPSTVVKAPPPPPAKTAPIDTVLFNDDSMSIEIMADLIFEDIGGHELINIARHDILNGQQISYAPIKNLGLIQQRYNPNNILGLQATSEKYFANFAIKFEEKVPEEGNGDSGSNVYFDDATGDLIIEGVNLNKDELFEVEVSLNGTIYEADFGATTS